MRPTKTERYLRCQFSDSELLTISKEISQNVAQRAQAENDKKRMSKEFDARIATMDAAIDLASEKVRSGYECKNVACSITYGSPRPGMKEIKRDDTGELVEITQMTSSEMQEELPLDAATEPGRIIDAEIPDDTAASSVIAGEESPAAQEPDEASVLLLIEGDIKEGFFAEALCNANAATVRAAIERSGGTGRRGKALKARLAELRNTPE